MTQKNDGGPAFPHQFVKGMSLRDWFAGQVLNGLILDPQLGQSILTLVSSAYRISDAMLAAREAK